MANWTVATMYKRFQQVLSDEYELDFKVLDGDNLSLAEIKEVIEKRIVREAMAEPAPKKRDKSKTDPVL